MDRLTVAARSRLMASIKGVDTTPELRVRSVIHSFGLRFRLHSRVLPGKPDIVMKRHRTIVFVHGCFWHAHRCKHGRRLPKSRTDFWASKRAANQSRDRRTVAKLRRDGWRVIIIWECQTKKMPALRERLVRLLGHLVRAGSI